MVKNRGPCPPFHLLTPLGPEEFNDEDHADIREHYGSYENYCERFAEPFLELKRMLMNIEEAQQLEKMESHWAPRMVKTA